MEGIAMKRFAAIALILSLGLFSFGCDQGKKAPKKDDGKAKVEAGTEAGAATDAKADDKKADEKK